MMLVTLVSSFGDRLRRLLSLLHDRQELKQALLQVISQNTCQSRISKDFGNYGVWV